MRNGAFRDRTTGRQASLRKCVRGAALRRYTGSATSLANARDLALETIQESIAVYNSKQQLVYFNRRYAEIFGLDPSQLRVGMTLREVVDLRYQMGTGPKMSSAEYRAWISRLVKAAAPVDTEITMTNGKVYTLHHRPMPGGGFVGTSIDITARYHAERRIQHMAHHDALTAIPNRFHFFERLDLAIAWLRGDQPTVMERPPPGADDRLLGVMFLDLDHFKTINDTLGHGAGDEVLRMATLRIGGCLREGDVFGRLGGDEFGIMLDRGIKDPAQVTAVARRVIEAIGQPFSLGSGEVVIGVTIGYTTVDCRQAEVDSTQLLSQADLALYQAKEQRGTCCAFEPGMDVALTRRTELERHLRRAIAEKALEVHFQPMFELSARRIIGAEALVRWTHPLYGPIAPSEFIPVAEAAGLIADLGTWVLRTACARAAEWGDLTLAVNLSPEQVRRPDLVDVVKQALQDSGLPPHRLELEITEGVLLRETQATVSKLNCLRELGIGIALDDFGTGYSSLSYLRQFPFSKLKIDRSFIEPMRSDAGTAAIVQAIASLGRSLDIQVVAEGIETEGQLEHIRSLGCDEGQGYLLGRPCSAEVFERLLPRGRRQEAGAGFGVAAKLALEPTPG